MTFDPTTIVIKNPPASPAQSRNAAHFFVLQALLLSAFTFHETELWPRRWLALSSIAALALFVRTPYARVVFSVATLLHIGNYVFMFPNLANHSNLSFVVVALTLAITWKTSAANWDDQYADFLRTLQGISILTYFLVTFHKLNSDFFDPAVSCANYRMFEYQGIVDEVFPPASAAFHAALPFLAIIVEGLIPLCLLIPAFRRTGIMVQCGLHFLLAPTGFTNFASFGMVLAWTFVHPQKIDPVPLKRDIRGIAAAVIILAIGLGFYRWEPRAPVHYVIGGITFVGLFSMFVWKYVLPNLDERPILLPRLPHNVACLVLVALFGLSNYFGLRTAGTFTMFSNLRTESETSNHLILRGNPLKVFPYQNDVVEVVSVDTNAIGFFRQMPAPEQFIPRIEFSRLLDRLKADNRRNVAMTVAYRGTVLHTTDAAFDDAFSFPVPAWQKKLFMFRPIPKTEQQTCLW